MSEPITRPRELSREEADKIASAITARARPNSQVGQPESKELHKLIISICSVAILALMGIFAWIAQHVITQQDDTTRRLATVEAKLDILLSDRRAR